MTKSHEQMREALLCAEVTLRSVLEYPEFDGDCEHEPRPICAMAKRAIAAIEQTLAAEPAPLVRLTGEEISKIENRVWANTIDKGGLMALFISRFAHAIMDAMIAKNGWK